MKVNELMYLLSNIKDQEREIELYDEWNGHTFSLISVQEDNTRKSSDKSYITFSTSDLDSD